MTFCYTGTTAHFGVVRTFLFDVTLDKSMFWYHFCKTGDDFSASPEGPRFFFLEGVPLTC